MNRNLAIMIAAAALLLLLAISGIHPYDRLTWVMEVLPILLVVPMLAATFRRFPLTTLLYTLIFIHAVILMAGGHYSYARVPLGYQTCYLHLSAAHAPCYSWLAGTTARLNRCSRMLMSSSDMLNQR